MLAIFMNSKGPKVFLSYAREDEAAVKSIHDSLKERGFDPWMDKAHIQPGQDWEQVIRQEVQTADVILIFLSRASISKRGYVQREFRLALQALEELPENEIFLIPVRLDDHPVPSQFSKLQWCNLYEPGGMGKLLQAVELAARQRQKDTHDSHLAGVATAAEVKETLQTFKKRESKEQFLRNYEANSPRISLLFGGGLLLFLMVVFFLPFEQTELRIGLLRFMMALCLSFLSLFFVGGMVLRGTFYGFEVGATAGVALFIVFGILYDPLPRATSAGGTPEPPGGGIAVRTPIMVNVPAGEFQIGTAETEARELYNRCLKDFNKPQDCKLEYFTDESPPLNVFVDEFWIDDIEVTQAAYDECVKAKACRAILLTPPSKGPNFPAVGVRWSDAEGYCQWRGKRLPSEAEWEKAARWDPRSKVTYRYPWGNEKPTCQKAHYGRDPQWSNECQGDGKPDLAEVTSYEEGKSSVGAYNMVGNAWELVYDNYRPRSASDSTNNPRYGAGQPSHLKTIKGGGWGLHSVWMRPADRYSVAENTYEPSVGFRCASSNVPR
jgi:formylglycine-generating enzyme required for sulfatase activity